MIWGGERAEGTRKGVDRDLQIRPKIGGVAVDRMGGLQSTQQCFLPAFVLVRKEVPVGPKRYSYVQGFRAYVLASASRLERVPDVSSHVFTPHVFWTPIYTFRHLCWVSKQGVFPASSATGVGMLLLFPSWG